MASSSCWRCLLRPSSSLPIRTALPIASVSAAAAPFSTSAVNLAGGGPSVPTGMVVLYGGHIRRSKALTLASRKKKPKKKNIVYKKAPPTGERKAFRKRIQLSNNNALAVPGLVPLTKEIAADPESVSQVFSLPDSVVDQLRAVEAFKPTQSWEFFRQPSILVRQESVDVAQKLQNASEKKDTLRLVVYGERIVGKSMLLLQAMTAGFLNDWLVVNIAEANDLSTARIDYSKIPNTNPELFSHPAYIQNLLKGICKSNERILSELVTNRAHDNLAYPVAKGKPLLELAGSIRESEQAWPVFQAFWSELTDPEAPRPPILFTLDGLHHIMRVSDYRSPSFQLIHSHDFALVRLFTDLLSGKTKLPHGGAVIGATTLGNCPKLPSVDLAIAQRQAEQDKTVVPAADPYCRTYDKRVDDVLRSVEVMKVKKLSITEARALMEYWAASGVLRSKVDQKTVADRWSVGGHGIIGEMERASLMNMRM